MKKSRKKYIVISGKKVETNLKLTRDSYKQYLKSYDKKRDYLERRYGAQMEIPRFSYSQWKENYYAMHRDLAMEVKAGVRKNIGSVNQELVSIAAYNTTSKQARRLKEVAKAEGQRISLTEIRLGRFDWTNISATYNALREEMSGKAAAHEIASFFFGSA